MCVPSLFGREHEDVDFLFAKSGVGEITFSVASETACDEVGGEDRPKEIDVFVFENPIAEADGIDLNLCPRSGRDCEDPARIEKSAGHETLIFAHVPPGGSVSQPLLAAEPESRPNIDASGMSLT